MTHRQSCLCPSWLMISGLLAACLIFPVSTTAAQQVSMKAPGTPAERLFTLKVLPLLKSKCFGCHGADEQNVRGGYRLLTRADMLRGGESGEPSLVPGKPRESSLYQAVLWETYEMPPKENDRLNRAETEVIRQWIAAGAPWPSETMQNQIRKAERAVLVNAAGRIVPTSGGLSDEWTFRRYQPEDLWAFQPLRTESSQLLEQGNLTQVVDTLIQRGLQNAGLEAARPATPRDLLRRATYDLTGLPPTPKETQAFLQSWQQDSDKAWEALIDRLLASPRYGEHWARHWLDITRYADTGGMSNDFERSNMWRYRDYVIRALNDDKPYDRFVIEQLAGDELADASVKQRTDGTLKTVHEVQLSGKYTQQEAEWIVATGFLRLGPWDNAMVKPAEARQMYLDDLVNITGQTFLAQTLRCCKCHDHKFDPIPTRDYYRIYSAFATTQMAERPVPFLKSESRDGFAVGQQHVRSMRDHAVKEKNRLIAKREAAAREWFKTRNLPYKNEQQRRSLPDEQKPPRHVGLNHIEQGQLKVREQDEWIWTRRLERYEPLAQSVYNAEQAGFAWNAARKLRIRRNQTPQTSLKTYILLGGALSAQGDQVFPGVLSGLTVPVNHQARDPYLLPGSVDGRRLALAKWIVHPQNAMASRAIVNRIWQYHFGFGLARNANNFGAKGAKPSHPVLLDCLARDFVSQGWRMKRLHKALMLSKTYRQSTTPAHPQEVKIKDPENRLLSYFPRRRLTAEELRDSLLSVSGELQDSAGGVPVMPEINLEVALQPRMIQFSLAPAYQPSRTPAQRNRRTIYAYHVRGQADPFTELFNQPQPNESCEARVTAAVTPQVFTLMNSDLMMDRAIAFARKLERETTTLDRQIPLAFQFAFGRNASAEEKRWLKRYIQDMRIYHREHPPVAVAYPPKITRSLVEEFSGQPFEYEEILPVFENYQPDKKSADVSPETRALADACLLLFNTNEFLYVE